MTTHEAKAKVMRLWNILNLIEQEESFQVDATSMHNDCSTCDISTQIAESKDRVRLLAKEYLGLSPYPFGHVREIQVDLMRPAKPVPESHGAGLTLSSHNSEMYSSQLNPAA